MRLVSIALLPPVLLSLACASIRVSTDHDPEIDFQRLERYAWLEPPLREAPGEPAEANVHPFARNTLLDKRVRAAVDERLAARGYRKSRRDESDFQLRYEVVMREIDRDGPVHISGGYGRRGYYGGGGGFVGSSYTYQEGTLILDVIDSETRRIAWRGWAATRTRDGHIEADRLGRTIAAILARFPPGGRAAAEGG